MPAENLIDLASTDDFALGTLEVSPSLREVREGGRSHILEPRVMQVLVALAERRGNTVSRDQLVERCWGGVIVGENAIQRCIGLLRKLAEVTGGFEITTLARVGYRLNEVQPAASGVPAQPPEKLLAVLPFDNLSDSPDFDYFSDGVAEEVLQSIARRSEIRVIGRTSSFQYRGPDKIIARIGSELGATHVLDGSVRRSGDRLRVSAHLMELAEQTLVWADRFDGDSANPFDLQDEVARAAVAALNGIFKESAKKDPVSAPGYDAMLRLRRLLNESRSDTYDEMAIAAVEALAPESAQAWGLVAKVRAAQLMTSTGVRRTELAKAARSAAERALSLNPDSGAAHKALFMLEPHAGRFREREQQLERARKANPEDGEILWSLYVHYLSVGRLNLSGRMAEEAYRTDPLQPLYAIGYANSLYTANAPEQALALMRHAVDRWPTDPTVFVIAIWTAAVHGETEFVSALLEGNWSGRYSTSGQFFVDRAINDAKKMLNAPDQLLEDCWNMLEASIGGHTAPLVYIALCAYLGADLDRLFDLVEQIPVERLREPGAVISPLDGVANLFLRVNHRLRVSPRFVELCARLGLVDYWRGTDNWPDCVDEVAGLYDFKSIALEFESKPGCS